MLTALGTWQRQRKGQSGAAAAEASPGCRRRDLLLRLLASIKGRLIRAVREK